MPYNISNSKIKRMENFILDVNLIKSVFADVFGNIDSLDIIKNKYSLLTRLEIIEIVKSYFSKSGLFLPENEKELNDFSIARDIVINDHRIAGIPQNNFLEFLSETT